MRKEYSPSKFGANVFWIVTPFGRSTIHFIMFVFHRHYSELHDDHRSSPSEQPGLRSKSHTSPDIIYWYSLWIQQKFTTRFKREHNCYYISRYFSFNHERIWWNFWKIRNAICVHFRVDRGTYFLEFIRQWHEIIDAFTNKIDMDTIDLFKRKFFPDFSDW